jgi:hypothetical protein
VRVRAAFITLALLGFAQSAPLHIRVVDYPRPVSSAVLQIEKHFGFVVTYEDVNYVHPDDIVDVTEQVARTPPPGKRISVMRGGTIDVMLRPRGRAVAADVRDALEQVLRASREAANAGDFVARCGATRCDVIPIAIRGSRGRREPFTPMLDARISFPGGTFSTYQFLQQFTQAVGAAAGRTLSMGTGLSPNFVLRTQVRVAGTAAPATARDVLVQALSTLDRPMSWQLLCDAGEPALCALNIHVVNLK